MAVTSSAASRISLAQLKPIFILSYGLELDDLHELEEEVIALDGDLTYDLKEARIFLARIEQTKRAAFELRSKGLWTEEWKDSSMERPRKRIRLSPPRLEPVHPIRTGSEIESEASSSTSAARSSRPTSPAAPNEHLESPSFNFPSEPGRILVIKLEWLENSMKQKRLHPYEEYLVYDARVISKPENRISEPKLHPVTYVKGNSEAPSRSRIPPSAPSGATITSILERAKAEAPSSAPGKGHPTAHQARRRFNQSSTTPALTHPTRPPKLHRTTTSEFEDSDSRSLPSPPPWVRDHVSYSCLRSTPPDPPNLRFIRALEAIKLARQLTLDEIGVRAYSTSIAAIAAYPRLLTSAAEILRLPGCDAKIAALWDEWADSADEEAERWSPTVRELEGDENLRVLKVFHEIWGVGPETARRFYFEKGWKDVDDVVEFGWSTLNRVQQIGVKFYDEFMVKIPRAEVEGIRDVVLRHARSCRGVEENHFGTERDVEAVIVGGYRRGKEECGDVDIILSHRDKDVTEALVIDVVASLEQEGWVTHTLTLNTTTSDRGQQTLPYRGVGGGHGFDSLDKALCVWQDPDWDVAEGKKNPNIHRRVDIIISSWRTVACAILGWSGGNTFQRDIRRYVKRAKGWKFDSSGVRDRVSGRVLNLERPKEGQPDSWLDREKRLMEGLGIGWRPPGERCTL